MAKLDKEIMVLLHNIPQVKRTETFLCLENIQTKRREENGGKEARSRSQFERESESENPKKNGSARIRTEDLLRVKQTW